MFSSTVLVNYKAQNKLKEGQLKILWLTFLKEYLVSIKLYFYCCIFMSLFLAIDRNDKETVDLSLQLGADRNAIFLYIF